MSNDFIRNLLESANEIKHDFLETHTTSSIAQDIFDTLSALSLPRPILESHLQKLRGYRVADELHLLHKGKYIRWLRLDSPDKLAVGGILVDTQFGPDGAIVLCRLASGRFMRYRFDKCISFQKLTEEECIILQLRSL